MNTWKVIRFNWPKYLAVLALVVAAFAAADSGAPTGIRFLLWAVCLPGCGWALTSIAATWWSYDYAKVYERLADGVPGPGTWAAVHAGFDDSVPALRVALGCPPATVAEVSLRPGPSLRRARKLAVAGLLSRPVDSLPTGSLDTLFVTFAAHEVRDRAGQRALFAVLRLALRPGGRLIITEHTRDAANFAVYGPGALHFQSLGTWHKRAAEAGLTRESQARIAPFITRVVYRR
jgi:SAM-dependent methyltransferase